MSTHLARPKKALCPVCRGALHATTITHEEKRDTHIYLVQSVPANVCRVCGDRWIEEEVLQQIDRLIATEVPVCTVETPVYHFSRTAAR